MAISLDLNKTAAEAKREMGGKLILDLKKQGMTRADAKSRCKLFLDVSGSAKPLYQKRLMHALAVRAGGVALNLDDNGELDVVAFDSGAHLIREPFTERNSETYIQDYVQRLVGGSTNYAPPLKTLLGEKPGDPIFVVFATDGENYDEPETESTLVALSYHGPIFVQFVGITDTGGNFRFLKRLNDLGGRFIDNAGFCTLDFSRATEEEVRAAILNEYPSFLGMCRQKGYLPWTKSPLAQAPGARGGGGLFGGRR